MGEEKQSEDQPRTHTEQPAEGDRSQTPVDSGVHPQEPAEGADPDAEENGPEGNAG
ncbi:hypothetical protein [Arthrobacter sp. JZ12]|uniref:hypothetical protein n=1 Tax=Arthrobacter sp. JZ12 TaxID=2654190 RepID=UPI002B48022E|nr:hypothetical protein [Arthrobacter sp. JZ12]